MINIVALGDNNQKMPQDNLTKRKKSRQKKTP